MATPLPFCPATCFLFPGRWAPARTALPEPDLKAQIQLAFDNLQGVLEAAGCTFDDVVDVTMFLVDPEASMGLVLEAMRRAFSVEPLPNATAVGVTWLSGFQFEIKVIARVPQKQ